MQMAWLPENDTFWISMKGKYRYWNCLKLQSCPLAMWMDVACFSLLTFLASSVENRSIILLKNDAWSMMLIMEVVEGWSLGNRMAWKMHLDRFRTLSNHIKLMVLWESSSDLWSMMLLFELSTGPSNRWEPYGPFHHLATAETTAVLKLWSEGEWVEHSYSSACN